MAKTTNLTEAKTLKMLKDMPAAMSNGGLAELSEWEGKGALWTRSTLRSGTAIAPETVEGHWYGVGFVRALAEGKVSYGFDDAKLKKAAKALLTELAKVRDLYDS